MNYCRCITFIKIFNTHIMASVKSLKKDIQYLTEIVITEAISIGEMLPSDEEKEKADAVVFSAVDVYNELIARVNHPDGKDNPKLVKQHYKQISEDLIKKTDELLGTLNALLDME